MKKQALTARQVQYMQADPSRRLEVPAGPPAGLYLVVQPSGLKSWAYRYRFDGRTRKLTLKEGYPVWSLAAARAEANRVLESIEAGIDPAASRELSSQDDTVGTLIDEFVQRYAKRKNRSWRETQRILRKETASWKARPVASIGRADILRLLDDIADRAPVMANRTHAALSRFFSWTVQRGLLEVSPVTGIRPPGRERSRDRVLTPEELCEVWRAAGSLGYPFGPLFRLLLLTAQRRGEVATMRGRDVDLDAALWTLPKEATKAHRAHDVPLSPAAVRLLAELPRFEQGTYLLTTTGGAKPVNGFSKAKARIDSAILKARREAAEERGYAPTRVKAPPRWTFHDLRRTAATFMAKAGTPPHVLASLLNHSPGKTLGISAIYIRHRFLDERREALDIWAEYLERLSGQSEAGSHLSRMGNGRQSWGGL